MGLLAGRSGDDPSCQNSGRGEHDKAADASHGQRPKHRTLTLLAFIGEGGGKYLGEVLVETPVQHFWSPFRLRGYLEAQTQGASIADLTWSGAMTKAMVAV